MKFEKYMAIYRNDNLIINDESVIGLVKDIKEYLKYELASQCMSMKVDFENLIDNGKMIFYLLEQLENENDNLKIRVYYNPMGALQYTTNLEDAKNE